MTDISTYLWTEKERKTQRQQREWSRCALERTAAPPRDRGERVDVPTLKSEAKRPPRYTPTAPISGAHGTTAEHVSSSDTVYGYREKADADSRAMGLRAFARSQGLDRDTLAVGQIHRAVGPEWYGLAATDTAAELALRAYVLHVRIITAKC